NRIIRLHPGLYAARTAVDVRIAQLYRPHCRVVAAAAFCEPAIEHDLTTLVRAEEFLEGRFFCLIQLGHFFYGKFDLKRGGNMVFLIAVFERHSVDYEHWFFVIYPRLQFLGRYYAVAAL